MSERVPSEAAHTHAPGLWCDECPDANVKRIERVIEDHREVHPREGRHVDCNCGWINPMNGTGYAHRKHVSAEIDAALSAAYEVDLPRIEDEVRERVALAIEARANDPEYVWVSGRQALNHAAGLARTVHNGEVTT